MTTTTTSSTPLGLTDSKTTIPPLRPGVVRREALVGRLLGSRDVRIVSLSAPAGYGKSTLLAQWAVEDPRPFAWLGLDERDDDPVLMLRYVLASLERKGLVDEASVRSRERRIRTWSGLLADVVAAVSTSDSPFVLVLDDVHVLSGEALDALGALARAVPDGVQLVLSGRSEITGLIARSRAQGHVLELGAADLALTEREAAELIEASGLDVDADAFVELYRRTEGWAAGLYLAVLATRSTGVVPAVVAASVDRFVDDYLRTEHLAHAPKRQLSFLAHSSVLERMCSELCDAVLERRDSRRMIEDIERSNLFLLPLDHERRWFRYHELFRAALQRELDRIDPGAAAALRLRAADWCEANGLPEEAMAYAIASDDTDRVARLLAALAFPLYRSGRVATLAPWFDRFDDGALLGRYPTIGVLGALFHALRGHTFRAERWLDAAAWAGTSGPLPDGSPSIRPWVAAVEAMLCRHGPERMRADATAAVAELGALSPFRPVAMFLSAYARLLQQEAVGADRELERAVEAADAMGATFIWTTAVAVRALLALDRGDVGPARELIDGAHALVHERPYDDYMPLALLFVADAQTAIREGDTGRAAEQLAAAQRLRPNLTAAIPFLGVQTLTEMAKAYLALGEVTDARAVLFDAGEILRERPDLGVLKDEVEDVRRRLAVPGHGDLGPSPGLTAAELRLLPLLTTHLTFREIGERLFVSRNTVKTEAISIYRKLGATSRGEAVRRASELGLVEPMIAEAPRITPSG